MRGCGHKNFQKKFDSKMYSSKKSYDFPCYILKEKERWNYMSRVWTGQKHINIAHKSDFCTVSKMKRLHFKGEDYHKAVSLSQWLFMKYDMLYKTFRRKLKKRRDELKNEYREDTKNRRAI